MDTKGQNLEFPRRRNVATCMVGLKWSHTQKISPKMANPRDIARERRRTRTRRTRRTARRRNRRRNRRRTRRRTRRNTAISIVGLKAVTYTKISPKMMNDRDIAGESRRRRATTTTRTRRYRKEETDEEEQEEEDEMCLPQ